MKRKAVSCLLVLAAIMTMTPTIPTMAAENPDNTTQEVTTTGTQGATITYEQDSAFTVTIPKTITLGQNKSATYNVKVKGDISGNETVTVTPDATMQLTDSNGKAAVTGTITQDITEFAAETVNLPDGVGTTGNIVANGLTSGDWLGNFEFAIGVDKELGAGLYNANDDLVCSWDTFVGYGFDVETDTNYTHSDKYEGIIADNSLDSVTKLILPTGITRIGNARFNSEYTNKTLTEIILPEGLTEIGYWSFGSTDLTNIQIPSTVTTLSDRVFDGCRKLTNVNIPDGVTNIGYFTFRDCESLETITIPDNVTNIGDSAFSGCTKLSSVTYKGTTYDSVSELTKALKANNVTVNDTAFYNTGLK